jgi:hypothetical protein
MTSGSTLKDMSLPTSSSQTSLAERRQAARPRLILSIPSTCDTITDETPPLITPANPHFPLVCPPAPAPPTITNQNRRPPTIILPDLTEFVPSPDSNMKAQPTTSSASRARHSAIYPTSKRASTSYRTASGVAVSPSSLTASCVSKRRSPRAAVPQRSYSSSAYAPSSFSMSSSRSGHVRPLSASRSFSQQKSQLALQHHQRAVFAQRAAARYNEINSLDRGIRMLLEEEYREDVKAWMLEKEVGNIPVLILYMWYLNFYL